jgi:ABC-type multidrug transport system permease subunit
MMKPLFNLILVHFKEFRRDPEVLVWGMLFPIALAWLLGIAFTHQGGLPRPVGLVAESSQSAELLEDWHFKPFVAGQALPLSSKEKPLASLHPRFKFVVYANSQAAMQAVKRGEIALYLESSPKQETPLYHFDPQNADAQLTYLLLERINHGTTAFIEPVQPLTSVGSRYIDFLIPGLIAMGIMNSSIWGTGWSLIERRMQKLLKRMIATPMPPSAFFFSYFFTRLLLTLIEVLILFAFSALSFHVQMQGSVAAFLLVFLSASFAFFGLTILSASRTASSEVGNGLLNAVSFPMVILSGIFFSYHSLPAWTIPVVRVLPLTLAADTLRMVFIEGAGLRQVLVPCLQMSLFGIVFLTIGRKLFKWY